MRTLRSTGAAATLPAGDAAPQAPVHPSLSARLKTGPQAPFFVGRQRDADENPSFDEGAGEAGTEDAQRLSLSDNELLLNGAFLLAVKLYSILRNAFEACPAVADHTRFQFQRSRQQVRISQLFVADHCGQ